MKTYKINPDANFSIIVNNQCNAKCSFCTGLSPKNRALGFVGRLNEILLAKPKSLYQCSITGGEPGICVDMPDILGCIERYGKFEKVVYTTNGTNLGQMLPYMNGVVNHINLSYHDPLIDGTKNLSEEKLSKVINEANKTGIDVTLSAVIMGNVLSFNQVLAYIKLAKDVGASAVAFRRDSYDDTLEYNDVTYLISKTYKKIGEGACPVCKSISFLIDGMRTSFKTSLIEPSKVMDEIFEFIMHPDGRIYTDWQAKKPFDFMEYSSEIKLNEELDRLAKHYDRMEETPHCGEFFPKGDLIDFHKKQAKKFEEIIEQHNLSKDTIHLTMNLPVEVTKANGFSCTEVAMANTERERKRKNQDDVPSMTCGEKRERFERLQRESAMKRCHIDDEGSGCGHNTGGC